MGGKMHITYPLSWWKMNDIWNSTDGVNWTRVGQADWSVREQHASVVFDNRIWVLGGIENGTRWSPATIKNDVWHTAAPTSPTGAIAWPTYP
jgi:hypothetical protein